MGYRGRNWRGSNVPRQMDRLSNMGVKGGSSSDCKCKHGTGDFWAMNELCEMQR